MSIVQISRALVGVPDLHSLTMKYEDGGKTECWSTTDRTVRVRGGANEGEIRAAFAEEAGDK